MITGFTPYRDQVIASLESGYDGSLGDVANVIHYAHKVRRPIIVIGNGGSMATALHFATDLHSIGIPIISPPSIVDISRIANDTDYENVFVAYTWLIGDFHNPLVIAFSCSGISPSIVRTCQNNNSILFTSTMHDLDWLGWPFPEKANLIVKVHSDNYEIIEDIHLMMCHCLKLMLRDRMKGSQNGNS